MQKQVREYSSRPVGKRMLIVGPDSTSAIREWFPRTQFTNNGAGQHRTHLCHSDSAQSCCTEALAEGCLDNSKTNPHNSVHITYRTPDTTKKIGLPAPSCTRGRGQDLIKRGGTQSCHWQRGGHFTATQHHASNSAGSACFNVAS